MAYRIVQFPLAGNPEKPIIVKVSPKTGGHKLDLDLLATDGDEVWRGKVRERHIDRLRDSEYKGPRQEWENLLEFALGSGAGNDLSLEVREGLDAQCKLSGQGSKSKLTISLQISVEDIKSKRGTFQLDYSTRTEDVSFYDWTCQLIDERNMLQHQVTCLQTDLSAECGRVESLQQQLNELIAAKKEQETQMLAKFARLLNEKKLRIRVQQRQIAEQGPPANSGLVAKQASTRKRKYAKDENDVKSDLESEGFDEMDVDKETDNEQEIQSDQGRRTESETESEVELGQVPQTNFEKSRPQQNEITPSRVLPFTSKSNVKAEPPAVDLPTLPTKMATKTSTSVQDSETESEGDDEL